ncbi:hypothetical protein RF11_15846 [Thelohanellus kitauei]|uniref:Tc1-like transposase DDE domain-containing protein n=1 Tax=Thelohanellus kitauei TaxID=669202 RepID=A0A0C2MJH8_THEKT|nr:hypothetical protein RF11_15846 [Thelohanellus kitauei]
MRFLDKNLGRQIYFLTAYSPQFHPIELLFSKWKQSANSMNLNNSPERLSVRRHQQPKYHKPTVKCGFESRIDTCQDQLKTEFRMKASIIINLNLKFCIHRPN